MQGTAQNGQLISRTAATSVLPDTDMGDVCMRGGHEPDSMDDPKQMLAELIELSTKTKQWAIHLPIEHNDPQATFVNKTMTSVPETADNSGDDLETLRYSLMILSSSSELANSSIRTTSELLDPTAIPFDTAEDKARKEIEDMMQREEEKLNAIIAYALQEELEYQAREEEKRRPSRLILSNLAADIDEEAIREFFTKYERNLYSITIHPERDQVKRTRTAHVDMTTRSSAVRASYEVGGIFGLMVKIRLAVE
ncbi:RNA-binding protein [Pyrenophora teres f. teres]|uniref:RNA-binding protein n=1 Tax=Pyrenophora teres f. teres TaxID=97479 RepID=A0A6S6WBH7_9PLEO|nr:RNA-binding protein [Pyrenophora teres f. teres]